MNDDWNATLDELERLTRVIEALEDALRAAGCKTWLINSIKERAYNGS